MIRDFAERQGKGGERRRMVGGRVKWCEWRRRGRKSLVGRMRSEDGEELQVGVDGIW